MICAVAGLLASVTGCGGGDTKTGAKGARASARPASSQAASAGGHEVILEVLGTGTAPGIYYNADSNGNVTNVALPWKKTARVPSGFLVGVLASPAPGKKVACRITVDGKVVKEKKKSASVSQCRYTLPK